MKKSIDELAGDSVYFTSELNDIYFIPPAQDGNNKTGEIYILGVGYYLFREQITCEENKENHIYGLGDIIRDHLLDKANDLPIGRFTITINFGSYYAKSTRIIYVIPNFGNPKLIAEVFTKKNFLKDCAINLLPLRNYVQGDSQPLLAFGSFDTWIKQDLYENRKSENSYLMINNRRIDESIPLLKWDVQFDNDNKIYNIYPEDPEDMDNMIEGFNPIQYRKINEKGKGFLFRNSFGLCEYVFIPGYIEEGVNKSFSEVIIGTQSEQVDVDVENNFSLKVKNAPQWLMDNAKALLASDCVYMLADDDPVRFDQIKLNEANVIIKELTGTISNNPEELSEFTLTFKWNEI